MMDGLYKITTLKSMIILFIIILAIIIFILQKQNNINNNSTEKYLILLTNIIGINSLILSNDWILTIISWELFNFSLY